MDREVKSHCCRKCGEILTIKNCGSLNSKYRNFICRICHNKQVSEIYYKNREYYRLKNNEHSKLETKEHRQNRHLKENYGITVEQYDKIFQEQKGVCAICGNSETMENKHGTVRLSVDHCHKTGQIRGLLCSNCNAGLGRFKDSINIVLNVIKYLRKHRM